MLKRSAFLRKCSRISLAALIFGLAPSWFASSFVVAQSNPSKMVSPANHSTGSDPYASFVWNPAPNAVAYYLFVGTTRGAWNIWTSGAITTTSSSIPGLQPNTLYYLRLWTKFPGNVWGYTDGDFTSGTGLAHFTNPVEGATDVDPAANFSWNSVIDAEVYYIYLSNSQPGGTDVYRSGELPHVTSLAQMNVAPHTLFYLSHRVFVPPSLQPHTRYYLRLFTKKAGVWRHTDSTFTTGHGIARLTSSANWDGAGGVGPTTGFTWNRIPDADFVAPYYLYLGTQPGRIDVWATGSTSATSAEVPAGLLQPNSTYYVRLWTKKHTVWSFADSAFSTGSFSTGSPSLSRITYPPDGATNVDPFAPVQWTSVPSAPGTSAPQQYFLHIGDGTTPGVDDRNYVRFGQTTATSWMGGLIGGKTYRVAISTYTASAECPDGCWFRNVTTFTTAPVAQPHGASAFYVNVAAATASVRNMATGEYDSDSYNVPLKSTFLLNNLNPAHNGVGFCSDFANNLVVQLQNQGIAAHRRDSVFGAGPAAHSIVEYYDPVLGKWAATDPTFGIMFYDPSKTPASMNMDEISAALARDRASAIPYRFVTSASATPTCSQCFDSYWALNYVMDPILDYLNPLTIETGRSDTNDPRTFVQRVADPVGTADVYMFSFAKSTDKVTVQDGARQITILPEPVTVPPNNFGNFSTMYRLSSGWSYIGNPPAGLTAERLACPLFRGPSCP